MYVTCEYKTDVHVLSIPHSNVKPCYNTKKSNNDILKYGQYFFSEDHKLLNRRNYSHPIILQYTWMLTMQKSFKIQLLNRRPNLVLVRRRYEKLQKNDYSSIIYALHNIGVKINRDINTESKRLRIKDQLKPWVMIQWLNYLVLLKKTTMLWTLVLTIPQQRQAIILLPLLSLCWD